MSGLYRKKPVVIEAVQWNPPIDGKARLARELDCPGVRSTSYEEIARILGTSGCSKEEPYWDWSVVCRYDRQHSEANSKGYMEETAAIHKMKYDLFKSLPKSPVKSLARRQRK